MRRTLLVLGLTLIATGALAQGRSVSIHDDDDFGDCNSRNVRFDGDPAVVERQELNAAGLRSLRVRSGRGPLSVRGGNAFSIVVCKAAEDATTLRDVSVRLEGNELSADGPGDDDWVVSYYVTVPRGAELDVHAANGPVSLRDVDGRLNVRMQNGPLSLRNVSGNVDAETKNGPVSLTGGSGDVRLAAQNGPLTVKLSGDAWDGNLEASTKNGPLSVKMPRNYRSGVTVEALGRGPVSCKAEGCEQYRATRRSRDWDDDDDQPRRIELGSGRQNVRLSTVNGPLTIRDEE